jgi:branched-chain amino acid transport system permease protein
MRPIAQTLRGALGVVQATAIRTHVRAAWWGIAGLLVVTVFFTTTQSAYSLYVYDSVLLACLGSISLQVLHGTAGLASVGTAAFLLIGAFSSVFFLRMGAPLPVDVVGATVIAGLAGLITGLPALRLRSLFLVLATLAAYFIAVFLGNLYESDVPSAREAGFFVPILFASQGELIGGRYWGWLLLICVSLVVLGASRIMRERSGRAMRLMREHELIAPTFGISVSSYKLLLFTLSSMVIGFEGALTAYFVGNVVTDNYTLTLTFQYVVMIVIGGLDSIAGAVLGAAVVIALPVWVPSLVEPFTGNSSGNVYGPNIATIVYGILTILFVTSSPDGLIGLLRRMWILAVDGRQLNRADEDRRAQNNAVSET